MALPQISISDVTAEETSGSATFDVTLDAPSAEVVTVDWATDTGLGPNAAAGHVRYVLIDGVKVAVPSTSIAIFSASIFTDFDHDFGTLTFAPGETRRSIAIPIRANGMPDAPEETFNVVLGNAIGAMIADGTGVGTILDAEYRLPPRIEFRYAEANEPYHGPGGAAALEFLVRLDHPFFQTVTVDYATQDGSALAGTDFAAVVGTLTFAPGETEKLVTVPLLSDTDAEGDETMSLVFSNPQGASLDPDWPPVVPGQIRDVPVPPPRPDAPHFTVVLDRALSYPLAAAIASPVAGLSYLLVTSDGDEAVLATDLGDFVNTRGGNDAVNGHAGADVLDGGAGGNILTGGEGIDMFFVDARARDLPTWTTVTDLEPGERVVIWGMTEADFMLELGDGWGITGLTGLTLVARSTGQPIAVTLTGYAQDDLSQGHLVTAFGREPISGNDYFYVQAV